MKKILFIMVLLSVNSFGSQVESNTSREKGEYPISLSRCGLCKKNFTQSSEEVPFACFTTNMAHSECYELIREAEGVFDLVPSEDRVFLHQSTIANIEEHIFPGFKVSSIVELRTKIGSAGIKNAFTSALILEVKSKKAIEKLNLKQAKEWLAKASKKTSKL